MSKPPYESDNLIEVWAHFDGNESERDTPFLRLYMPFVPRIGESLRHKGETWRVADVRWTIGIEQPLTIWSVIIFMETI